MKRAVGEENTTITITIASLNHAAHQQKIAAVSRNAPQSIALLSFIGMESSAIDSDDSSEWNGSATRIPVMSMQTIAMMWCLSPTLGQPQASYAQRLEVDLYEYCAKVDSRSFACVATSSRTLGTPDTLAFKVHDGGRRRALRK